MLKSLVFGLEEHSLEEIVSKFGLQKILHNDRVCIYENADMRFSFYDKVVRILLFKKDDQKNLNELYKYFYNE